MASVQLLESTTYTIFMQLGILWSVTNIEAKEATIPFAMPHFSASKVSQTQDTSSSDVQHMMRCNVQLLATLHSG